MIKHTIKGSHVTYGVTYKCTHLCAYPPQTSRTFPHPKNCVLLSPPLTQVLQSLIGFWPLSIRFAFPRVPGKHIQPLPSPPLTGCRCQSKKGPGPQAGSSCLTERHWSLRIWGLFSPKSRRDGGEPGGQSRPDPISVLVSLLPHLAQLLWLIVQGKQCIF